MSCAWTKKPLKALWPLGNPCWRKYSLKRQWSKFLYHSNIVALLFDKNVYLVSAELSLTSAWGLQKVLWVASFRKLQSKCSWVTLSWFESGNFGKNFVRCLFPWTKVLLFYLETQCATLWQCLVTCPGVGSGKVTQPQKQIPPDIPWVCGAKGSGGLGAARRTWPGGWW